MPRYVILEHDHPHRHWDLMLEAGTALRTWRLAAPPATGQECAAAALGDHRLAYLDYEGSISGGRGTVTRWDAGTFRWVEDARDRLAADLTGTRCQGRLRLTRRDGEAWEAAFDGPGA